MDSLEQAQYELWFDLGFRELYLEDIERANDGDVRMGTFILCATFLDALSLTYSAGLRIRGGKAAKWARFTERYLGDPYEPIWDSYDTYRNKLLHNYSARGIGFTHGPTTVALHLRLMGSTVMLHRESFLRDVVAAFDAFSSDVRDDAELRTRAFDHLLNNPPMGLVSIPPLDDLTVPLE